MGNFLSFIFLGLSLAAPIGPINAAQMNKGLTSGFVHAWLVGLGAVIADIFYMLLVYLGAVHLLEISFVKTFLWSFGSFVLIYTGIECLIQAGSISLHQRNEKESYTKSFFSGFLLSISNPLTILFWLGIYGSVLAQTISNYSKLEVTLYSIAIVFGLLIWDIFMACISSGFRHLLNRKAMITINWISGLTLIGFGFFFALKAIQELFYR